MSSSATGIAQQVNDLLGAVTPAAGLDDEGLRARLVQCEQAMNMLQAVQADAMVQMGVRARAADQAEVGASGKSLWSRECRAQFVADEFGVLLGCTKMAATVRYGTACHAAGYPAVQATGWTSRPAECGPGCSRPQSSVLSSTLDAP